MYKLSKIQQNNDTGYNTIDVYDESNVTMTE